MIDYDHYKGFQRLCERNPKISVPPSKAQLEKIGCRISDTFYLIEPSGRVVNPASVNPEILEDEVRKLFERPKLIYETNGKNEFKESHAPIQLNDPTKKCTECGQHKPIDQFGKKAGRGGKSRKDVCLVCEEAIKARTIGDITGINIGQEPKHEEPNAAPIGRKQLNDRITKTLTTEKEQEEQRPFVGNQQDNAPVYVTVERVKELVTEAYLLGVKDGKAQSAINIVEPTLNDILRA